MAYEVDRLEIVIETATKRANKELDNLIKKLNQVSTSLRSVATAAQQINKANLAISKTNEKLAKTGQLSRKAATEINNSSRSIVNSSVVERLEMEKKMRTLNALLGTYGAMNNQTKLLGGPMLQNGDALSLQIRTASEEYVRFGENAQRIHQNEQEQAERSRAAWERFINQLREAIARMNNMEMSYAELNAKVMDYDGSLSSATNAVVKLRQVTEQYRQVMSGVTDITNLTKQEQDKIAEAYKQVANAANEARAAQEILKASELANNKGFGMSNLVGKDIQKEINQFNAEYTKTRYNAQKVNEEMAKHKTNMGGANSALLKMRRTLLNIISLVYIIRRLWSSINKALDFGETINLFQTVFRKLGMDAAEEFEFEFLKRAEQFRDNLAETLTLNPNDVMNYMANFAQMANSMGVVSETAYRISESLTVLGADVASLFNVDIDTAMERLKAGLSGQIRPMRMMGVDISKTTLQMIAMKHGITESIETMDAAAKVQLRYLAMTEQLTIAMGDMARTIDNPANQLRVLRQQWENFTRTIGTVFVPIVTKVLPILNGLLMALTQLSAELAAMMGYVDPDFTEETIYAMGELEDQVDDTDESLRKLRATLGGFDELNLLSSQSGEDIMGSGFEVLDKAIMASNEAYMEALNEQIEKMSNTARIWRDRFLEVLPTIISITTALLSLHLAIKTIVAIGGISAALKAGTGVASAVSSIPIIGKLAASLGGLGGALKGVGATLAAHPIAAAVLAIVAALVILYNTNEDVRNSINAIVEDIKPAFENIIQSAKGLMASLEPILEKLPELFQTLGTVIAFTIDLIGPIIVYVVTTIVNAVSTIIDSIAGLTNFLTAVFSGDWEAAWQAVMDIFNSFANFFIKAYEDFGKLLAPIIEWIGGMLTGIWDGLVIGFETAWAGIEKQFKDIATWFQTVGSGIGDVFKELLNDLISGLNWVLSQPFSAINNILKGIRDINIFGAKPFNWISTVQVPQIPLLAQGGIVDYGQMFIAREAGPELVGGFGSKTGVMNNEQIVDAVSAGVANAVAQVMAQIDFGGRGEQNVNVFLDGRQISSAIEQTRRQQGVAIVRGGNK